MARAGGAPWRAISAACVAAALIGAGAAGAQGPAAPPDGRQRVLVPVPARDKILLEMRHMLEAVAAIHQGLAEGSMPRVEQAARGAGLGTAAEVNPEIRRQLPQQFLTLGMQTHRKFDELAERVKGGGGREDALKGLAEVTANCVACHASYRLDETR